mmetsp:Transcript_14296/g.32804  ORF Transcript_14296/g.32804 Transcript_14296/m.32804 type:complete len:462 (+) Transcript_14296:261-1646(+)
MSEAPSFCANCGKSSDTVKLKNCTACYLVKYCSVDCQRSHRKHHKNECRQRAAELEAKKLSKKCNPTSDKGSTFDVNRLIENNRDAAQHVTLFFDATTLARFGCASKATREIAVESATKQLNDAAEEEKRSVPRLQGESIITYYKHVMQNRSEEAVYFKERSMAKYTFDSTKSSITTRGYGSGWTQQFPREGTYYFELTVDGNNEAGEVCVKLINADSGEEEEMYCGINHHDKHILGFIVNWETKRFVLLRNGAASHEDDIELGFRSLGGRGRSNSFVLFVSALHKDHAPDSIGVSPVTFGIMRKRLPRIVATAASIHFEYIGRNVRHIDSTKTGIIKVDRMESYSYSNLFDPQGEYNLEFDVNAFRQGHCTLPCCVDIGVACAKRGHYVSLCRLNCHQSIALQQTVGIRLNLSNGQMRVILDGQTDWKQCPVPDERFTVFNWCVRSTEGIIATISVRDRG